MKHLFALPIFLSFSTIASAQDIDEETGNDRFSIKAQTLIGFYIDKSSNVKAIDPSAPTGINMASGLAVVNEHWYTQKDQNPDHYGEVTTNTTFGSYLNVYLSGGLNMDFPITRNFAVNGELAFVHISENIGFGVGYDIPFRRDRGVMS
ncbi:MAG: hypothetical protein IJ971_00405 [Bacteroidales bacterium]|nr:hypothetical protein [Bacteroidales bacterium]